MFWVVSNRSLVSELNPLSTEFTCIHLYLQCSKLLPVCLPEADNFGGGPGTFLKIFFNFMFMIWDSRQEDWQLFWLSFEHWYLMSFLRIQTVQISYIPPSSCSWKSQVICSHHTDLLYLKWSGLRSLRANTLKLGDSDANLLVNYAIPVSTIPSLFQVMACCLLNAKPLPALMRTTDLLTMNWNVRNKQPNSELKIKYFLSLFYSIINILHLLRPCPAW